MYIEQNFDSAEVYLEMAREKVKSSDFVSALANLRHAYSATRELIDLVFSMQTTQQQKAFYSGEESS